VASENRLRTAHYLAVVSTLSVRSPSYGVGLLRPISSEPSCYLHKLRTRCSLVGVPPSGPSRSRFPLGGLPLRGRMTCRSLSAHLLRWSTSNPSDWQSGPRCTGCRYVPSETPSGQSVPGPGRSSNRVPSDQAVSLQALYGAGEKRCDLWRS